MKVSCRQKHLLGNLRLACAGLAEAAGKKKTASVSASAPPPTSPAQAYVEGFVRDNVAAAYRLLGTLEHQASHFTAALASLTTHLALLRPAGVYMLTYADVC